MKRKLFVFYILSTFIWLGCSQTYVQVMQVNCTDCAQIGSYYAYENDTIRVVYYFWAENGVMGFSIQNKTNIPIYIDWKKCSYVLKKEKNDYWKETAELTSYSETNRFAVGAFSWIDKTLGTSTTLLNKPERVTFIPPGASISRGLFNIKNEGLLYSPSKFSETRDTVATTFTMDKKVSYKISRFVPEQSPISFSSFLRGPLKTQMIL